MKKALLWVVIHAACVSGSAALAQEEFGQDVSQEILQQLVAANDSLDELVKLVRHLAEQQEADVLVRRLEIEERAVLALRPELTRVREERDEAERQLKSLGRSLDRGVDNKELREQLERGIPFNEERLAELERRVQELEFDLEERRKAIKKLKGALDEAR